MIDAEVMRLRELRNTSLRVRALARALESDAARRNSLLSRSARSCWRIARVCTGTLRGHPYPSFQRGPSPLRGVYYRVRAGLLGGTARYQDRRLQTFYVEMLRFSRTLDDTRALTLSAELSDTLGRSQPEIRGLLKDLHAGARAETGAQHEAATRTEVAAGGARIALGRGRDVRTGATRQGGLPGGAVRQDALRGGARAATVADDADIIEGDWPYIAL
jgi:hypothetical protein